MRPRAIDYLHFVMQYASRLDIVGFAAFGFGEAKTTPAPLTGLSGSLLSHGAHVPTHRSIRVLIARKAPGRFTFALDRAGTGEMLMMWQAGSVSVREHLESVELPVIRSAGAVSGCVADVDDGEPVAVRPEQAALPQ
jgi:hypothetical protein